MSGGFEELGSWIDEVSARGCLEASEQQGNMIGEVVVVRAGFLEGHGKVLASRPEDSSGFALFDGEGDPNERIDYDCRFDGVDNDQKKEIDLHWRRVAVSSSFFGLSIFFAIRRHLLAPVLEEEALFGGEEGVGSADEGTEGGGHLQGDEEEDAHPDFDGSGVLRSRSFEHFYEKAGAEKDGDEPGGDDEETEEGLGFG